MKAHVSVDAASKLVHSVAGTAANESDVSQAHALLHGHEKHAFGDAGYTGVEKREEMRGKSVKWQVAVNRGKIKAIAVGMERASRRASSSVAGTIAVVLATQSVYVAAPAASP